MENFRTKARTIIKQAESWLKTDVKYLLKGGFWLTVGQGIAMMCGFAISLAFANFFPKESFGIYKYIISVSSLLVIVTFTGLSTSVIQSTARGFGGVLRQGFRINLKWSIGFFLSGAGLSIYYLLHKNGVMAYSFLLAAILAPLTASATLYTAYLFGKKDFKRSTFYGIFRNIIPALALILTLLVTKSLGIFMTVYFCVGALVPLFFYYRTLRVYRDDNKNEDPELVSYSGHLSAMDIMGNIANYLDKILVFHYLGAAQLAIYAFAIAPVEQLQGGKKILSSLIQPKINERSFSELQQSAPRKAFFLIIYALVLAGVYALLVPYFYKFFYPQYHDSIFYSQIYSLTLLAVSGTVFNETMIAHKMKKELYVYRIVVPLVEIILFFVLLPIYGLMGLIIANIVSRSLAGILGYYFVMYPFKTSSKI